MDSDDEIDVSLEIDLETFEDVTGIESEDEMVDLSKPVGVVYCGSCGLPPEFCDWGGKKAACKTWKQEHAPHLLPGNEGMKAVDPAEVAIPSKRKEKKAKNKEADVQLMPGGKKKAKEKPGIKITRDQRNKRKYVTMIEGLETFDIKLAAASKVFSRKLSCGASIVKNPMGKKQIDVQGDFVVQIVDIIKSNWPEIDTSLITIKE
jgi:density-regulated protein DRP1